MRVKAIVSVLSSGTILLASLAGGIASAAPSTLHVSKKNCSDLGTGTQKTPFCTIQTAVNAANNGTTIDIDKGTYAEQVAISGKNNLTFKGNGNNTVIQMPSAPTTGGAIVDVTNATGLDISSLKVAGPFNIDSCATPEYGVRLNNAVTNATIEHVAVTDIRPASDSFFGCQQGVGILVGRQSASAVATATLHDVDVSGYAKVGVLVDNTGSSATIDNSTITGRGPTALTALNGIQVSRGASAVITQSKITGNVYTGDGGATTATGVLLYQAGQITAKQNTVNKNDVGFDVDADNSSFTQNTANNNTTNGFFVESTASGDTFRQNTAKSNDQSTAYTPFDVEDDSNGTGTLHTANTWHNNDCKTSAPAQLCKQ